MSRVASNPIPVPAGVDINITGQTISVKGAKGTVKIEIHAAVDVAKDEEKKLIKILVRDLT